MPVNPASTDTVKQLQRLAYLDPKTGILSPHITGGVGNSLQDSPGDVDIVYSEQRLCFPCVYIKWEVIDRVGYLDETLTPRPDSYGFEDDDYCRRVQLAGFKLAVTGRVTVQHLCSSTFKRNGTELIAAMNKGRELYQQKWGCYP